VTYGQVELRLAQEIVDPQKLCEKFGTAVRKSVYSSRWAEIVFEMFSIKEKNGQYTTASLC
jgi:hypothetical protein